MRTVVRRAPRALCVAACHDLCPDTRTKKSGGEEGDKTESVQMRAKWKMKKIQRRVTSEWVVFLCRACLV